MIKENEIIKFDVLNRDKTSCQIGFEKAKLMIAIDLCKSLGIMKPEDRYYLTSVKCISSAVRLFCLFC